MTYRVRRKLISTTFKVNQQLCKIFLEPWVKNQFGMMTWNMGFAIGKSHHQLNDWYKKRRNKRFRSLHKQMKGKSGVLTLHSAYRTMLKFRWNIPPGDCLVINCDSAYPDKQYHAYSKFLVKRGDFIPKPETNQFFWTRPPYPNDEIIKLGKVIPQPPQKSYVVTPENYWDFFYIH